MSKNLALITFKKLQELTPIISKYNDIIERRNKTDVNFNSAKEIAESTFKQCKKIIKKITKIFEENSFSLLKQAEFNELIFLFQSYKKMFHDYAKSYGFLSHLFLRKKRERRKSQFVIKRNALFIFVVNFITRNFYSITLPADYDVNKFQNDTQKISLANLYKETSWENYFLNKNVLNEFLVFSNDVISSNWWNHAKFFRNNFVHRISLDTYNFDIYEKLNIRVKTYLPMLCVLSIKYFFYSLVAEKNLIPENIVDKNFNKIKQFITFQNKKATNYNIEINKTLVNKNDDSFSMNHQSKNKNKHKFNVYKWTRNKELENKNRKDLNEFNSNDKYNN